MSTSVSELARRVGLEPTRLYMAMRVERNKRMVAEWQKGMRLADQAMAHALYGSPVAVPDSRVADMPVDQVEKGTGRTTTLLLTAMAAALDGTPTVFIAADELAAEALAGKVSEWADLIDVFDLPLHVMSRNDFSRSIREDLQTYRDKRTVYDHEQPRWV